MQAPHDTHVAEADEARGGSASCPGPRSMGCSGPLSPASASSPKVAGGPPQTRRPLGWRSESQCFEGLFSHKLGGMGDMGALCLPGPVPGVRCFGLWL